MKDLDEFLPLINQFAPGCATPTAHTWIRQACMDFCERTRLWRFKDTTDVTLAEADGITTPDGSVLIDIEQIKFDGKRLEAKTAAWLDENMEGWDDGLLTGTPCYYSQVEMNTLILVPFEAGTVDLRLVLKPSQDCDQVPDFIVDQYRETIAHGALGRILAISGQPYSNPQMASAFVAAFNSKLDMLTHKATPGQQRARTRTKGNFF